MNVLLTVLFLGAATLLTGCNESKTTVSEQASPAIVAAPAQSKPISQMSERELDFVRMATRKDHPTQADYDAVIGTYQQLANDVAKGKTK